MQLNSKKTKWVFFLSADGEPEPRHIFDLSFGLLCLESNGANFDDIEIYVDGTNRDNIEKFISAGTKNSYPIKSSQDFFDVAAENTHENLVIFVTGHGSHLGIDASPVVTPHKLLSRIRSTPHLDAAIVFLGQCYAGTFNYIGAGRKKDGEADVIFIGATNLHQSLSLRTTEKLVDDQEVTWPANVFLLYTFKWFLNPVDIDGDGKTTIMDCYKFAGCMANTFNRAGRRGIFEQSLDDRNKYVAAYRAYQQLSATPLEQQSPLHSFEVKMKELEVTNAEQTYQQSFDLYHTHQECWILNSIPAQQIELRPQ